MKKPISLLLSFAAFGSISSVAFADIAPGPGEKDIPACSIIDNLNDFPNVAFLAAEYPYYGDNSFSVSQITDQSCVSNKKWSEIKLFAVDKKNLSKYVLTQPKPSNGAIGEPAQPADPEKDMDAYTLPKDGPEFSQYGLDRLSTAEADRTQYKHDIYHIIGFDNSARTIIIALVETKTAVEDQKFGHDGTAESLYSKELKNDTAIFNDVSKDNDYAPAVLFLRKNGYVKGYDDGTYKPEQTINRAEFTKIVMHDFKSTKTYDCSKQIFKDVSTDANNWYRDYVCKAYNEGIIIGYGDNTFRPEQPITFSEAAKIILKVEERKTDGPTDPWYNEFINYFEKNKILPNTIKSIDKKITRGDMALLVRSIIDPLFYKNEPSIIDPLFYNNSTITAPQSPQPAATSVSIQNMAFSNSSITVKKGTKVTWTNKDNVPHTVTSDSGNILSSGNLANGESYTFTFNDPGSFTYHCANHPSMTGSVIVTE